MRFEIDNVELLKNNRKKYTLIIPEEECLYFECLMYEKEASLDLCSTLIRMGLQGTPEFDNYYDIYMDNFIKYKSFMNQFEQTCREFIFKELKEDCKYFEFEINFLQGELYIIIW